MSGAARGEGAGRRITSQREIYGVLVRHPPEVVLPAHGTGGPDRQARSATRDMRRPRRTRRAAAGHWPDPLGERRVGKYSTRHRPRSAYARDAASAEISPARSARCRMLPPRRAGHAVRRAARPRARTQPSPPSPRRWPGRPPRLRRRRRRSPAVLELVREDRVSRQGRGGRGLAGDTQLSDKANSYGVHLSSTAV
jgi:hypothetical protein